MDRDENRDLIICLNCRWSASLLRGSAGFNRCPVCASDTIESIPVNDHERYAVMFKGNRGFEIEFQDDS